MSGRADLTWSDVCPDEPIEPGSEHLFQGVLRPVTDGLTWLVFVVQTLQKPCLGFNAREASSWQVSGMRVTH